MIDWEPIARLIARVRAGETGRPPYEPLAMFRTLLLQQWYGLSDPGLEEALLDRVSFRRFCGLALDVSTPHETTLCQFRDALSRAVLGEALFQEVLGQLEATSFVLKTGRLIDATLVRSFGRTPPWGSTPRHREPIGPRPGRRRTRYRPGRRLFFGYKTSPSITARA